MTVTSISTHNGYSLLPQSKIDLKSEEKVSANNCINSFFRCYRNNSRNCLAAILYEVSELENKSFFMAHGLRIGFLKPLKIVSSTYKARRQVNYLLQTGMH